ncbi:MAG: hypothetical protein U0359_27515 [Byssovorax sp.]
MWSRPAQRSRTAAAFVALALLAGCSGGKGKEPARPLGARIERRLDPVDLMPADLDLVLRLDLGRMRAGIGPSLAQSIADRALASPAHDVLLSSLPCADVLWLGARAGDIDGGDHVIVLEGKSCAPEAKMREWSRIGAANAQVTIFTHQGEVPRAGTAEVIALSPRATAFVSPVERDSVRRLLREGPDPKHGDPRAEGLLSLDLRVSRLPPALEKRFPSIGNILAGVARIRATAVIVDEGVQLDAEILSPTVKGAERARDFLRALVETLAETKYKALLDGVKLEVLDSTLKLRLTVPKALILALATSREAPASAAGPDAGKN